MRTKGARAFAVKIGVSDASGTDNYGSVATMTIAANVDLVNRAPVFEASERSRSINEGAHALDGSIGAAIVASDIDNDPGDLNYALVGTSALFKVDTKGGQLKFKAATNLDRETTDSYKVTVAVDDGETSNIGRATVTVAIEVGDVPEPPVFVGAQRKRIAIIGVARKMTLVAARDLDDGDSIATYAIASIPSWITHDSTDSTIIDINPPNSARGLHKLTIVATDSTSRSSRTLLTLDVIPDLSINSWKLDGRKIVFDIANDSCASFERLGLVAPGFLGGILRMILGVDFSNLAGVSETNCDRTFDGTPFRGSGADFNFKVENTRVVYESKAALALGTHSYVFHNGIQEADPERRNNNPIIAQKTYNVTYQLTNATVTVGEIAGSQAAANTKLATLTLPNAVPNAQWAIVGTPAVAVGVAAVSGSETTEGALSLTAAAAVNFESGADFLTVTVEATTPVVETAAAVNLTQVLVEWKIKLSNINEPPEVPGCVHPVGRSGQGCRWRGSDLPGGHRSGQR